MKPGADAMTRLEAEALGLLIATHGRLLERFAASKRNELHLEVKQFRIVLSELASWARQRGFVKLADKARWWEWYWYEREYGDSQFESLAEDPVGCDKAVEPVFLRDCRLLRAYTIDPRTLASEIRNASAAKPGGGLAALSIPADQSMWSEFNAMLRAAPPNLLQRFRTALERGIRRWNPAASSPQFFSFLTGVSGVLDIKVERPKWHEELSNITVTVVTQGRRVKRVGSGAFHPGTSTWLIEEEMRLEDKRGIRDLKAELLRIAA